jgi:hypothetical protein
MKNEKPTTDNRPMGEVLIGSRLSVVGFTLAVALLAARSLVLDQLRKARIDVGRHLLQERPGVLE